MLHVKKVVRPFSKEYLVHAHKDTSKNIHHHMDCNTEKCKQSKHQTGEWNNNVFIKCHTTQKI